MSKMPPIPPENRTRKGPAQPQPSQKEAKDNARREANLEQQGQQGNVKQNTTHQGYQQDR